MIDTVSNQLTCLFLSVRLCVSSCRLFNFFRVPYMYSSNKILTKWPQELRWSSLVVEQIKKKKKTSLPPCLEQCLPPTPLSLRATLRKLQVFITSLSLKRSSLVADWRCPLLSTPCMLPPGCCTPGSARQQRSIYTSPLWQNLWFVVFLAPVTCLRRIFVRSLLRFLPEGQEFDDDDDDVENFASVCVGFLFALSLWLITCAESDSGWFFIWWSIRWKELL